MSETLFKKLVLKDLNSLPESWILKTQERSVRGIPDIIACVSGMFLAIELKDEGKEPDDLQYYRLRQIKDAKGISLWATPSSWSLQLKVLKSLLRIPEPKGLEKV